MAQLIKNPLATRETWVRSLGWDDPLEKEKATHSSILAERHFILDIFLSTLSKLFQAITK